MGETQEEDRTACRRHNACGTEGAITSRQGRRRDPESQDSALPSTNGLSCAGSRSGVPERASAIGLAALMTWSLLGSINPLAVEPAPGSLLGAWRFQLTTQARLAVGPATALTSADRDAARGPEPQFALANQRTASD